MNIFKKSLLALATIALIATGCKNNQGELSVMMTDSPGNYAELYVEIDQVEVYNESEGWVALQTETQTVNVVELNNGAFAEIASSSEIEAGSYTRSRVRFGSNNYVKVYDQNGNTHRKELKFDGDAMVEMDMSEEVMAKSKSEIRLDFNIKESVEEQPGDTFKFEPSLNVMANFDTGVKGQLDATFQSYIEFDGEKDYSAYTDANGNFTVRGMEEGNYDIYVYLPEDVALNLGLSFKVKVGEVSVVDGEVKSTGLLSL